jgi:hypothetical protein
MPNHTVTKTVQPNSSLKSLPPAVCCSSGYNATREAATNSLSPAHPASVYMASSWWEVLA